MTEIAPTAGERFHVLAPSELPPEHPVTELERYWSALADQHGAPLPRKAFNPMKVPRALAWAVLLERGRRSDGELDYFVRLHGSEAINFAGQNWTGDWLGRHMPFEAHATRVIEFETTLTSGRPCLAFLESGFLKPYHNWIRGTFPFCVDGRPKQILLLCIPDLAA